MVKIKLKIDPTQPRQVEALNLLLGVLGEQKVYPTQMVFGKHDPNHSVGFNIVHEAATITDKREAGVNTPEKSEATTEPKTRRATKVVPPAEEEKQNLQVHDMVEAQKAAEKVGMDFTKTNPAELKTNAEEQDPNATLENIREELGKKVTDHREQIKGKLTELGAKNVSVLDASHYTKFYSFLTSL